VLAREAEQVLEELVDGIVPYLVEKAQAVAQDRADLARALHDPGLEATSVNYLRHDHSRWMTLGNWTDVMEAADALYRYHPSVPCRPDTVWSWGGPGLGRAARRVCKLLAGQRRGARPPFYLEENLSVSQCHWNSWLALLFVETPGRLAPAPLTVRPHDAVVCSGDSARRTDRRCAMRR
jgi:hypothetical protein